MSISSIGKRQRRAVAVALGLGLSVLAGSVSPAVAAPTAPAPGRTCEVDDLGRQTTFVKVTKETTGQKTRSEKVLLECVSRIEHEKFDGIAPPVVSAAWEIVASLQPYLPMAAPKPDFTPRRANDPCRLLTEVNAAMLLDESNSLGGAARRGQQRLVDGKRSLRTLFISTDFAALLSGSQGVGVDYERHGSWDSLDDYLMEKASERIRELSLGRFDIDFVDPASVISIPDMAGALDSTDPRVPTLWGKRPFSFDDALNETLNALPSPSLDAVDVIVWRMGRSNRDSFAPARGVRPRPMVLIGAHSGTRTPEEQVNTLVHELLHALGLPDLYGAEGRGDLWAGPLSTMSGSNRSLALTGYERWVLGWIPDSQVQCITGREGKVVPRSSYRDIRLQPPEGLLPGGRKLIVIRTAANEAIVVEQRIASRLSASLPRDGISIYTVNSDSYSGNGADVHPGFPGVGKPPILGARLTMSTLATSSSVPGTEWADTVLPIVRDEVIRPIGSLVNWSGISVQSERAGQGVVDVDVSLDWSEIGPFTYDYEHR